MSSRAVEPVAIGDDDEALVERARGDRAAFGPIYDRYVTPVYRYCYRRLGVTEAAEDATSLVFEKAMLALPRYRSGPGSFRSWLFTIAHNVIADKFRARHPVPFANPRQLTVAGTESTPEELALAREASRTIWQVLAHLPPEQARLLELRLAGLNDAEIARVVGISHGAVRVAQHRALRRLRELLGPTMEEGDV